MGGRAAATAAGETPAWEEDLILQFARLMRQRYGAFLYMFGSRVKGTARPESDYDLVAVSNDFAGQHVMDRALERSDLWIAAGGWRISLDLHCYTPEEFREELKGLGYLGMAKRRGQLVRVPLSKPKVAPRG